MDTRQLAAFCAVVERGSFSQAAERLGVTQPAVSLQIRSLEKRLGQQLLDRSGRRVEPTEAGVRLYRGAQRLLALEEQLLDEVSAEPDGAVSGRLEIGASSGPGGSVLPLLLCEFQAEFPEVTVALSVFDTQTVVDLVARRELELGVVGAARRHRGVVFEPFLRDEVIRPTIRLPAARSRWTSSARRRSSRCRRERASAR
jgi:DNA-binding transcriptional LysR family regulator